MKAFLTFLAAFGPGMMWGHIISAELQLQWYHWVLVGVATAGGLLAAFGAQNSRKTV